MFDLLFGLYMIFAFVGQFLAFVFIFVYIMNIIKSIINIFSSSSRYDQISLNPVKVLISVTKSDDSEDSRGAASKSISTILHLLTIVGLIHLTVWFGTSANLFGNTQIGSYFEKRNYTETYYVKITELIPFTKTEEYKCKAWIEKDGEGYKILEVEHPKGYILDFQGAYLELEEWYLCDDQIGVTWDVMLTTERVE